MSDEPKSQPQSDSKQDNMHDKCKQVVAFHNHLTKFLLSIRETCPELKRDVAKCVKYYKKQLRAKYIRKTHGLMEPHIKLISEYDEMVFNETVNKGPVYLIPGLDFKKLFTILNEDEDTDEKELLETKRVIFNHLQAIYLASELSLAQIDQFDGAIKKQKKFLMDMLGNLKLDDTLKEKMEKLAEEEKEAEGSGNPMEALEKLGDLFGEDNFIFQLVKEVATEVNLDEGGDTDSPVDAINKLFENNGQKLQELIVTIGDKLEQKVKSGEITQEQLEKSAKQMKGKLEGLVGNIPGLSDMTNPEAIKDKFKTTYESMSAEDQEKYKLEYGLLDKDMKTWSESEKQKFDEFAKYAFTQQISATVAANSNTEDTADTVNVGDDLEELKDTDNTELDNVDLAEELKK